MKLNRRLIIQSTQHIKTKPFQSMLCDQHGQFLFAVVSCDASSSSIKVFCNILFICLVVSLQFISCRIFHFPFYPESPAAALTIFPTARSYSRARTHPRPLLKLYSALIGRSTAREGGAKPWLISIPIQG